MEAIFLPSVRDIGFSWNNNSRDPRVWYSRMWDFHFAGGTVAQVMWIWNPQQGSIFMLSYLPGCKQREQLSGQPVLWWHSERRSWKSD